MYQNLSKVIVIVIAVYGLLHEISAIITWPLSAVSNMSGNRCESEDPGVASLIPAPSHTFVEIDYKIISMVSLHP